MVICSLNVSLLIHDQSLVAELHRGISSLLINHNAEALSFIESVIYNDNFWGAIKYLYCNLWISHSSNAESVICSKTD